MKCFSSSKLLQGPVFISKLRLEINTEYVFQKVPIFYGVLQASCGVPEAAQFSAHNQIFFIDSSILSFFSPLKYLPYLEKCMSVP